MKSISMIGLLVYFGVLLIVVTKEKKNEDTEDYFFGGRKLPFWALSITFIASWWGAGSALSTADLAFEDGMGAFWYYGVPVLLSTFLMILMSKAIRKVGYLTQGAMMKSRYNSVVSKSLSFLVLLFMVFSAASQMVGVGDFFGSYLGLNYELAVILGTVVVLIYSMFGGFRGVVITDVIQFILLLISAVMVFVVAMNLSGGFDNIMSKAESLGKPDFGSLANGSSKYMMYVITFGCSWMIQANVWQRISAVKTDKDAKKMTIMSFFAYIPLYLIVVFTGMAAITIFDTMPEGGVITAIVSNYMSPLMGMIVFLGISSAIMSTMDSLINTGAMTIVMDLVRTDMEEKKRLKISRYATLGVALVALVIALRIRSILDITWIASDIITTGVFVPLVMGFLWRRGNSSGAVASIAVGATFSTYNLLIFLGIDLPAFWEAQSAVQVITGVCLSLIVYVTVSLLTKPEYEKSDDFIKKAGIIKYKEKNIT